jgi:acetoin utilization deacetylase AcuC-like enzyme
MQVVYTPAHLGHDITVETLMGLPIPANEVAERAENIRMALEADGGFTFAEPTEHGEDPITAVHEPGLVRFLEGAWSEARRQELGRPFLTADTYPNRSMFEGMSPDAVQALVREPRQAAGRAGYWGLDSAAPLVAGTYSAARAAVDVALTTVDLVLGGAGTAYGLCRPPGHHAARSMYGGYCFFNNAAIAAEAIVGSTGERVAVFDVDYHHGNGTQQIFWNRGDVRYASIHADPDRAYPYFLGRADEVGEGAGAGENLNLPLHGGATNEDYLAAVDRALEAILETPGSVIVVSLGFDTYGLDPIGDFALTTDVYHEIGRRTAATGRRLVILQEGGYHRPSLGENARAWLRGAEGRAFDPLPAAGFGERGAVAG